MTVGEVLRERVGLCYAKSHLRAALLRVAGIPTGLCYQRLAYADGHVLHGLVVVYPGGGRHRQEPRDRMLKHPALPRAGGTLVVASLDRLGRSPQDLIMIVADLRRRRIGFRSLQESLDTTTPGGRLVFHVFAALAEFLRELIVDGTHEGLAADRARGQ
ncbi:recombinase family protein [Nocardia rhamnosiphila]|uniref:recombinase family protein n=1 Tax=Nocardia rhamnosiphila TaxID=426716 RepID=UPI000B0DDA6C|nr:recombinase family protein [Nocardia rhamnosiphila]